MVLLAGFWAGLWYQGQRKGAAQFFFTEESGAGVQGEAPETREGSLAAAGATTGIDAQSQATQETREAQESALGIRAQQGPEKKLAVHVVGRVASPGLYFFVPGSRIYDAVMEAEPEEDADLGRINMAVPIEDGMQIRVPIIGKASSWDGEALVVKAGDNQLHVEGGATQTSPSGKVNINAATAKELETLPGIGPAYSQRIIQYREQNGGFRSIEDLVRVNGIGTAKMNELRDKVCLS